MDRSTTPIGKRSRTSGKHSRNGCGTCKIRRVKCDETKPVCRRCQNFKITCDGYSRVQGTSNNNTTLSRGLPIAPRPSVSPSIPPIRSNPSIISINNEEEYRYITFFRDELLFEITQFSQGDEFRSLVLQSSDIPSIRHTMVALSALSKAHSILHDTGSTSLSVGEPPEAKAHRKYSLCQYAKGLAITKESISTGGQDLRTTLLTCLLIICIECLHGNFAMAGVQVSQGMALLRDWRQSFPNAKQHPIGFSSPAPHIVEDSIVQILGSLEIQSYSFDDTMVPAEYELEMEEGQDVIQNMPARFQSIHESWHYLELVTRRTKHWLFSVGSFFKPPVPVDNENISYTPLVPSPSSETEPSSSRTSSLSLQVPLQFPSQQNAMAEAVTRDRSQGQKALYLGDLHRWKASFDALLSMPSAMIASSWWKKQLLAYKKLVLITNTMIEKDEMVYDKYTEEMTEILGLAEAVIPGVNGQPSSTTFTIFQRWTCLPYNIGLHCRVGAVRRRAIRLLESLPKLYSSDSVLMSTIVKWVMELEEVEMVDGFIPEYARIKNISVSVDADTREATLFCTQRVMTKDGILETERTTIVSS